MNLSGQVRESFVEHFGGNPALVVRAPGRVNLIGEHTDYNEGFVLPMALDRAIWLAVRPRTDRIVCVHSLDFGSDTIFPLDELKKDQGWVEYLKGVAYVLQADGHRLSGWDGVIRGDVPRGSGLSSSAALELAAGRVFAALSGLEWRPAYMARVGQRAENEWVGVNCGIMDQMASAACREGHALFLDCRSLDIRHVPLPPQAAIVVMDTSTRRGLVDSAYNERRSQCEEAARFFGVRALRDLGPEEFEKKRSGLNEVVMRRARHIVTEDQRVLEAVAAMQADDVTRLGNLLNASHASLRDDFEVTNEALNQIVDAAQSQSSCYGARMTGAGFGGCAVALVDVGGTEAFVAGVAEAYREKSGLASQIYICQASAGASVVDHLKKMSRSD
ncbi:MAG TPA: galactokinase [Anaerolineales bacterium]|nr:galactokinase [Anaerolineales bacterium]